MLSETTKNTLDNVLEALDSKIEKRLDQYEISQQKAQFNTGKSNYNFADRIQKGLVKM